MLAKLGRSVGRKLPAQSNIQEGQIGSYHMRGFEGIARYRQDDFVVEGTLHTSQSANEDAAVIVAYTSIGTITCPAMQVCSVADRGGVVWERASCPQNDHSHQDRESIGKHHISSTKRATKADH